MYVETRSHARNQAHLTGASATVLALVLAGYGLVAGLAAPAFDRLPKPLQAVVLPKPAEREIVVPPPSDRIPVERLNLSLPPLPFPETFEYPDTLPDSTPAAGPAEAERGPGLSTAPPRFTPKPPAPIIPPRLTARETPPYPPPSVRAGEEGVTGLSLCVDPRGRVTLATLAVSSGHPRLDEAALKWIRTARFTPATQAGAPVATCNFPVDYEWRLERGR